MRKLSILILLSLGVLVGGKTVHAQKAYETSVKYLKNNVSGYAADFNIPKNDLAKIADEYFKGAVKGKRLKSKDYYLYRGINITEIFGQEKGDLYYKVEGNKKSSKLILLVSKGYDNFVNGSSDAQVATNTKNFLDNFQVEIDKFNKQKLINDQKELISKTEKEHKGLLQDQSKIEKKIQDLEKDLDHTKKKISDKTQEVEQQKVKLSELENI